MWRVSRLSIMFIGVLLGVGLWLHPGAAAASKLVLPLGDATYISPEAVKAWTGADVEMGLGEHELVEFAVVILSNVPFSGLPGPVQERLHEFLSRGGSLLITGGPSAYGSGGYQAMANLIPFGIRAENDWRSVPFKPVIPLQPGHPILQGVTFQSVGALNDLNPKPGAVEIAQYAGGQVSARKLPSGGVVTQAVPSLPLIVEQHVGQGTVVGIAFDLGQEVRSGWTDGSLFLQNLLTYLVNHSPLVPKPKEDQRGGVR